MSYTSTEVKRRYNEKTYDRFTFQFPKGYKEKLKNYADSKGMSVAGLVKYLIDKELGGTENGQSIE